VALALLWLIGASFFLYRSIGSLQAARTTRDRYAVHGDLVYIDSAAEKPKLVVSKKHGLSGRPHAVVVDGAHHIPGAPRPGRALRGARQSRRGARRDPESPGASAASPARTG